ELLTDEEEIAPAASLLAHCIYLSRLRNIAPSSSALDTLNRALPKVLPSLAALIEAVSLADNGGQQFVATAQSLDAARNSEDIAFDLTNVVIAARRFLDTKSAVTNPDLAILAIELLGDHAFKGSPIGTADSPVANPHLTSKRAAELSREDLKIAFVGRCDS